MWKEDPSIIAANVGIFPCQSCGEMIYSDVEKCRFCSAPVDRKAAASAAAFQTRVNSACNQAKLVRNAAGVMWLFLLLSTFPFMPFSWGFLGLLIGIPIWLYTWQARYGGLESGDADFKTAKRDWLMALLMWVAALVVQVALIVRAFLAE